MRFIARALGQLAFGWDTITAFAVYALGSIIMGWPTNPVILVWCGFWAYAPDLDFSYFLLQSPEKRKWGHWRLGFHHPMLVLPLFVMLAYTVANLLWPGYAMSLTAMACACMFLHFVHDSTKMGLHWMSPVTVDGSISFKDARRWSHWIITPSGVRRWTQEEVDAEYARIANESERDGTSGEVANRLESVTELQVAAWLVCLVGILVNTIFHWYVWPF